MLYYRIADQAGVDALAANRGYRNRDEVTVSPAAMGDAYEAKVRMFFDEHLHEDEEIRYVKDGRGYFDVRDREDRWVRIELEKVRRLGLRCCWNRARWREAADADDGGGCLGRLDYPAGGHLPSVYHR